MKKSEITELLKFLKEIEIGKIQIIPNKAPALMNSGNIVFDANNGWKLTIFMDSNDWDYIDQISTNDGRTYEFDDFETHPELREYCPPQNVILDIYKFTGHSFQ